MDQVADHIIKAMSEIMQFFGVMPVVIEHIFQECEGFLRRGCRCVRVSMSVRMSGAVCVCMRVAVSAVIVRMRVVVTVLVDLVLRVLSGEFVKGL